MESSQLNKTAGINFQHLLDLPSDHQGNNHYMPGKKDEKISDSVPAMDDLDMVKEEKMTQVLSPWMFYFVIFYFFCLIMNFNCSH